MLFNIFINNREYSGIFFEIKNFYYEIYKNILSTLNRDK